MTKIDSGRLPGESVAVLQVRVDKKALHFGLKFDIKCPCIQLMKQLAVSIAVATASRVVSICYRHSLPKNDAASKITFIHYSLINFNLTHYIYRYVHDVGLVSSLNAGPA